MQADIRLLGVRALVALTSAGRLAIWSIAGEHQRVASAKLRKAWRSRTRLTAARPAEPQTAAADSIESVEPEPVGEEVHINEWLDAGRSPTDGSAAQFFAGSSVFSQRADAQRYHRVPARLRSWRPRTLVAERLLLQAVGHCPGRNLGATVESKPVTDLLNLRPGSGDSGVPM